MSKHAIHFFESQFQRQVAGGEFVLNPFERMALVITSYSIHYTKLYDRTLPACAAGRTGRACRQP